MSASFTKLKNNVLIEVARLEKAFLYSAGAPNYITMTVGEALNSGAFDTCNGTMLVYARIMHDDGTETAIFKKRGVGIGYYN